MRKKQKDLAHKVVEAKELSAGVPGALGRCISGIASSLVAAGKANRIYDELYSEEDFPRKILDYFGIEYGIDEADVASIPKEGGCIIIANHPTGTLEGIVFMDLIPRLRPDADLKFLSTFFLNRVEPLRKYIFLVDPFDSASRSLNLKALKAAIDHVQSGGVLVIFPSGEISTWQKGFKDIKDKRWTSSAMKLIRKMNVPIVPVYVEAKNSLLFHRLGKIHPLLRTAMIPRELFNKTGNCIRFNVGTAINPRRLESLDDENYYRYLRASVEYLKGSRPIKPICANSVLLEDGNIDLSGIVEMPPLDAIKAELAAIDSYKLFTVNGQSMYCVPSSLIPNMMTAIGREREINFRQVGEGSMKACDTDKYDEYYHQMFLWDENEERLIGGYRMGFGDEIVPRYGLDGFYTQSLFRYSGEMLSVLEKGVELGRSFVTREYQRRPTSLMMLWKGILYVMLKYSQFRYLIGPVTISGEFSNVSKQLIIDFLKKQHYNTRLAQYVHPVTGLEGIDAQFDDSLVEGIDDIELINRIVTDIEQGRRSVPVLIRKYLDLQSSVLGFNVDHDFCDALDALMILDMTEIPDKKIEMLSKEITEIDVLARFKNLQ